MPTGGYKNQSEQLSGAALSKQALQKPRPFEWGAQKFPGHLNMLPAEPCHTAACRVHIHLDTLSHVEARMQAYSASKHQMVTPLHSSHQKKNQKIYMPLAHLSPSSGLTVCCSRANMCMLLHNSKAFVLLWKSRLGQTSNRSLMHEV